MNWSQLPSPVIQCCHTLWQAGFQAYPVGGGVRDLLLGRQPLDWDVATSARPEQVSALFSQTIPTGIRHGTVTLPTEQGPIEITTFRQEGVYSDGRHPDQVSFDATLIQDLARRDFTINAMALDRNGTVIDPFDGQVHLAAKIIRCVGEPDRRFSEDALRMFRAVRFSAQLAFELPEDTAAAIRRCAPLAQRLAPERMLREVEQVLLSPRPGLSGALFGFGLIPGLPARRPEGILRLTRLPARPLERWAGLCACLLNSGVISGSATFLSSLRIDGKTIRSCASGEALWRAGLPMGDCAWRHALAQSGPEPCRAAAAMGGEGPLNQLESLLASRPCYTVEKLALSGGELTQLGYAGPAIGAVQRRLLSHVLDHPQDNCRERLLSLLPHGGPK